MQTTINQSVPGSQIGLTYSINEQNKLTFTTDNNTWHETSLKKVVSEYSSNSAEYRTALNTVRYNVLSKLSPSLTNIQQQNIINEKLSELHQIHLKDRTLTGKLKIANDGQGSSIKIIQKLENVHDHHLVRAGIIDKGTVDQLSKGGLKYTAIQHPSGNTILYSYDPQTKSLVPHTCRQLNLPITVGNTRLNSKQIAELANTGKINNFSYQVDGKTKTGDLTYHPDTGSATIQRKEPGSKRMLGSGKSATIPAGIIDAINKRDFSKIRELKKQHKFIPSSTFINQHILTNPNLKNNRDKLLVLTSMGVKTNSALKLINPTTEQNHGRSGKISKGAVLEQKGKKLSTGIKQTSNKLESTVTRTISGM